MRSDGFRKEHGSFVQRVQSSGGVGAVRGRKAKKGLGGTLSVRLLVVT